MTDAVWCIPTRGINYLVSHRVGCRLVHPDTWYQLFGLLSCRMPFGAPRHVVSIKCHTPSRRMPIGASRQVGHFFNAICHHDGCRLLHPAKWDIGKFRGAFMTDADLCILSGGSFDISINSHLFGFQISHFNPIITFVLSFQRYTQSMYLFHILIPILIHVLISYTH